MNAYFSYLNELVNKNKITFSGYSNLKWLNPYSAGEFQEIRNKLLTEIGNSVLFKGTKPYYNHISEGCKICGEGTWSCLFITGKCNGKCFYCPTEQKNDEIPTSQGLTFPTAKSYAEYVNYFKFKGVSFSGGEPLLFPERVIEYLSEIRKQASTDIYTWIYTNGILANNDVFNKLAETNLNEVRFDIGATGYNLDKIKFAKGKIKNLSIEIPAIPEEKEKLMKLLPEIIKAGVTNLNLHQLRLTEFNAPQLSKRNYTYIQAERPIVLESEIAALEIINFAKEQNLEIGINYCSFFFKNRFQSAGYRKLIATGLKETENDITSKGYIRKIDENKLCYFKNKITDEGKLTCKSETLKLIEKSYSYCKELSDCQNFSEITKSDFINMTKLEPIEIPSNQELFKIWNFEHIETGIRDY
ncbi:MAG: radical SAM protein [Bacteroidales bacterium]|nr:radical SAM protein [Bacteroidales bacterium]